MSTTPHQEDTGTVIAADPAVRAKPVHWLHEEGWLCSRLAWLRLIDLAGGLHPLAAQNRSALCNSPCRTQDTAHMPPLELRFIPMQLLKPVQHTPHGSANTRRHCCKQGSGSSAQNPNPPRGSTPPLSSADAEPSASGNSTGPRSCRCRAPAKCCPSRSPPPRLRRQAVAIANPEKRTNMNGGNEEFCLNFVLIFSYEKQNYKSI